MVLRVFDIHQFVTHSFAVSFYLRVCEEADSRLRRAMLERIGDLRGDVSRAISSDTLLGSFCVKHGFSADDLDVLRIAITSVSAEVDPNGYKDFSLFRGHECILPHEVLARFASTRLVRDGYVRLRDPFLPETEGAKPGPSLLELLSSAPRSGEEPSFAFEARRYDTFEALMTDLRILQKLAELAHRESGPPSFGSLIDSLGEAIEAGYGQTLASDAPFARFLDRESVSFEELVVIHSLASRDRGVIFDTNPEALVDRYASHAVKLALAERGLIEREFDWFTLSEKTRSALIETKETKIDVPSESFESLILPDETIERIRSVIGQATHTSRIFDDWGIRVGYGKGVTMNLVGPPGTGKTLAARAIAHELEKPLLAVKFSEISSMWVGETEKNIAKAFREASEQDAVLFFDEADALTTSRENAVRSWEVSRTNTLLTELEAFGGVCIFATNFAAGYDHAFNRRLSAHITFDLPDAELLSEIFEVHVPEHARDWDVDFEELAERFAGVFSGGDVKNVVIGAARTAAHEGSERIMHDHFERACIDVLSGKKIEAESYIGGYIG